MDMDVRQIYKIIIDKIEDIVGVITTPDNHSMQLKRSEEMTQKMLSELQEKTQVELKHLEQQAVWDKLMIAFYGETNSGKSTTVEALRLLLDEPTKQHERKAFKKINKRYEKQLDKLNLRVEKIKEKHNKSINNCEERLVKHKQFMEVAANSSFYNLLNRIRIKLGGLPGPYGDKKKRRLEEIHNRLVTTNPLEEDHKVLKIKKRVEDYKKALTPLQDGATIGNGEQDFTQSSKEYDFEISGKQVGIIDMPGIEGKESDTEDAIRKTMDKVHCVFYVINADKLPERRTIDKIKRHLYDQAEVYVLINCRANNYILDSIPQSIGDLYPRLFEFKADVDDMMSNVLHLNYKGSICVQSLLGFYSQANLIKESPQWRKQHKLIEKFGEDALFKLSNIELLVHQLEELSQTMDRRVERVNILKGLSQMTNLADMLDQIRTTYYSDRELSQLEELYQKFTAGTEVSLNSFKSSLQHLSQKEVDDVITRLRGELTVHIQHFINQPNILKSKIAASLEQSNSYIQTDIEKSIKPILAKLESDIMFQIKEFESDVSLLSQQTINDGLHFDVDLDYDYQTSMKELAINCATFVGTVLTFGSLGTLMGSWVPVLGNFVGGLLGSVAGMAIATWNWIRGDRKDIKALRQLENSLRNEIRPQLVEHIERMTSQLIETVEEKVYQIEKEFEGEIVLYKEIVETLKSKAGELRLRADQLRISLYKELDNE